jgi:YD repeat-containing protein
MRIAHAVAAAAATLVFAAPASAQPQSQPQAQTQIQPLQRRQPAPAQQPGPPSPLAQQALAGGDPPDVLLDVPNLSVEQISIQVKNLQVELALEARLANLLHLSAGARASVDDVRIEIAGVRAQATLIVRLDNVRAIIERTLQTLDNNPQIVTQLLSTVDNTVGTVGGLGNNALNTVGNLAGGLLRNGQLLDLARAGLSEVGRTVNAQGQTVRQARDTAGNLIEVVTDTANRIISSRRLGGGQRQ